MGTLLLEMGGKMNGNNDAALQGGDMWSQLERAGKDSDIKPQQRRRCIRAGHLQRGGVEWFCFCPDLIPASVSDGNVPALAVPTSYRRNNPLGICRAGLQNSPIQRGLGRRNLRIQLCVCR